MELMSRWYEGQRAASARRIMRTSEAQ